MYIQNKHSNKMLSISRSIAFIVAAIVLTTITDVLAFSAPTTHRPHTSTVTAKNTRLFSSPSPSTDRNPDRPELPTIPGDFDWDSKYAGDADWLMGDAVPGKRVMNEIELATQITSLGGLEEKWRKERLAQEYNDGIQIGWVYKAEVTNGRFAMFFLLTGLLTEYWTGISLPGQVEEMLRIAGVISM